MISRNGERSMKIRTSLLAVIASVVLLGCTTSPGHDRPSGATGEQPKASQKPAPQRTVETPFSAYFVGKAAPFTSDTEPCPSIACTVEVNVDANCNVSAVTVL